MPIPMPINDERLTPDMQRVRSGETQLFRRNYSDRQFISGGNADVILQPPERHLFAELIDGVWHWVNGCAECNGKERSSMTYIECEKHDVCRTCKTPRSRITAAPWGGRHGWQCKPCAEREHEEEKSRALAAMPEEHDELDYWHEDNPRCPYCNYQIHVEEVGDLIDGEREQECPRCDSSFTIEAECSISYTTRRKRQGSA